MRNRCIAVVATMVVLGACAATHNGLNTSASACFKALPEAEGALHHHGRLRGVRRVDNSFGTTGTASTKTRTDACAFAFEGPYAAGAVALADPSAHGTFAVVVVTASQPRVIRVLVTDRLPIRFRHRV